MSMVIRWGRSAYELDADLAREQADAEGLGYVWKICPDQLPNHLAANAEILVVTSGVQVTASILQNTPIKLIVATTSGFDHIDINACRFHKVVVVRLAQARRDAVVEQTIAQLTLLLRRFGHIDKGTRSGRWERSSLPALSPKAIQGSTIAVVGLGVIGRRVSEILTYLGAHVLGVDPAGVPDGIEASSLNEALTRADAVTLHCSLNESTRGLISAEMLSYLRPSAVIINTARGEVLDVHEAVKAVRTGRIYGLAVDVFPEEPWPYLLEARDLPNVWFSPHAAGFVHDLGARVSAGVQQALYAWKHNLELPFRVV